MLNSISVQTLEKYLINNDKIRLIDVRRQSDREIVAKNIATSSWLNPEKMEIWSNWIKSVEPEILTVVYCARGGQVSQKIAGHLQKENVKIAFLEGGLATWIDENKKTQTILKGRNISKTTKADVGLLVQSGMCKEDIEHSLCVMEKSLEIAARTKKKLDMELIRRGALFHDLGKAKTHEIEHGLIGAQMGVSLGLSTKINSIMGKHIRGGLTINEALELGLPAKDYSLNKLEERIIIYSDRLVDILNDGIVPILNAQEAEDKFELILKTLAKYGKTSKTTERYLEYHNEIQGLISRK